MFVIRPVDYKVIQHNLGVGESDQNDNGVDDADPPIWDAETDYTPATGAIPLQVSSPAGGLNNIYVAQSVSGNKGQNPDEEHRALTSGFTEPPENPFWRLRRKTNEFTFNDERPTITTGRNDSIVLQITTTEAINTIGFIGLNGTEVSYSFTTATGRTFNQTAQLSDIDTVSTYEEYLRSPISFDTTFLLRNIPAVVHTTSNPITITINNPGGLASVGQIVMGYDTRFGIVDASTVNISSVTRAPVSEDAFGVTQITPRASAKNMSFTSVIERTRIGAAQLVLEKFLTTPAIYYVSEDNSFGSIVYGILIDAEYDYYTATENHGRINASIRGII